MLKIKIDIFSQLCLYFVWNSYISDIGTSTIDNGNNSSILHLYAGLNLLLQK